MNEEVITNNYYQTYRCFWWWLQVFLEVKKRNNKIRLSEVGFGYFSLFCPKLFNNLIKEICCIKHFIQNHTRTVTTSMLWELFKNIQRSNNAEWCILTQNILLFHKSFTLNCTWNNWMLQHSFNIPFNCNVHLCVSNHLENHRIQIYHSY